MYFFDLFDKPQQPMIADDDQEQNWAASVVNLVAHASESECRGSHVLVYYFV
jgi:hypothetical protein